MSKKPLELYVVLGNPPESTLAAKVWMESKGDTYVTTHGQPLAGKYSYHESGMDHHDTNLTGRRSGEGKPLRTRLRNIRDYVNVTGLMTPTPLEPTGYEPKPETRTRRTMLVPAPKLGWYFQVWAIETGRRDLAERISETDPWPAVPVGLHS